MAPLLYQPVGTVYWEVRAAVAEWRKPLTELANGLLNTSPTALRQSIRRIEYNGVAKAKGLENFVAAHE
jgi:hypothetical protein